MNVFRFDYQHPAKGEYTSAFDAIAYIAAEDLETAVEWWRRHGVDDVEPSKIQRLGTVLIARRDPETGEVRYE